MEPTDQKVGDSSSSERVSPGKGQVLLWTYTPLTAKLAAKPIDTDRQTATRQPGTRSVDHLDVADKLD
jgi:hypothetical protein